MIVLWNVIVFVVATIWWGVGGCDLDSVGGVNITADHFAVFFACVRTMFL